MREGGASFEVPARGLKQRFWNHLGVLLWSVFFGMVLKGTRMDNSVSTEGVLTAYGKSKGRVLDRGARAGREHFACYLQQSRDVV